MALAGPAGAPAKVPGEHRRVKDVYAFRETITREKEKGNYGSLLLTRTWLAGPGGALGGLLVPGGHQARRRAPRRRPEGATRGRGTGSGPQREKIFSVFFRSDPKTGARPEIVPAGPLGARKRAVCPPQRMLLVVALGLQG